MVFTEVTFSLSILSLPTQDYNNQFVQMKKTQYPGWGKKMID